MIYVMELNSVIHVLDLMLSIAFFISALTEIAMMIEMCTLIM